tara:strand:+ start:13398 stop:14192 length:795 start_codon:yes stop_codon:yes gene_type:complete
MVYQRGVHQIGIKNEANLLKLLNDGLFSNLFAQGTSFIKRGGTQTTSDIDALSDGQVQGISIKNWSGATYDWVNTSKFMISKEVNKIFQNQIRRRCEGYTPEDYTRNETTIRKFTETILDKVLDLPSVWEHEVERILGDIYDRYPEHVIVTDRKKEQFTHYHKRDENFNEFVKCSSPDWGVFLKKGRGNSSRQIWRRCNTSGREINTNLRIRIVLNNGVGALCGFSSANKNSSVCLKIQQENVDNHMNSLVGTSIEKFNIGDPE